MKTTNSNWMKALLLSLMVLMTCFAVYAVNDVEPSAPTSITFKASSTNAYPNGTKQNLTRGFIHTINIDEKAPTMKWIGYVGNITGSFALQDARGYALYQWTIITTRGEVYATKEGPAYGGADTTSEDRDWQENGGIPNWESITCANSGNITREEMLFNHTIPYGAKANEDRYTNTFTTPFTPDSSFYVGEEVQITGGAGCYGVNLNVNGTSQAVDWDEIVLMDGSYEVEFGRYEYDLIYAALIENNTRGYRNGSTYDFQMMLPQSGLEGPNVPDKAYWFYIELV